MYNTFPNVGDSLWTSINHGFILAGTFIPNILAGIIILLIGIILGSIAKRVVLEIFRIFKIEAYLHKYGVPEAKKEFTWSAILSEIVRWFVIILFLIPASDIWRLPQIGAILDTFLLYIPNVFVAAIMGLVGMVLARLAHDVVLASVQNITSDGAQAIASAARWAINIFVILAVLNQLGVAQDLIRILFTGFVAMIAIAGGIAFGLGGQDTAKLILDAIRKHLK